MVTYGLLAIMYIIVAIIILVAVDTKYKLEKAEQQKEYESVYRYSGLFSGAIEAGIFGFVFASIITLVCLI